MSNNPTNSTVLSEISFYGSVSISSVSIILNLLLLIPVIIQLKSKYTHIYFLNLQFLIGAIINGCCLITYSLHLHFKDRFTNCKIIVILRNYTTSPMIISAVCITFINLLYLKKYGLSNKKIFTVVFVLLSWLPPSVIVMIVVFLLEKGDFFPNSCVIYNETIKEINTIIFFTNVGLMIIICTICQTKKIDK